MEVLLATVIGALVTGLAAQVALHHGKRLEKDHWLRDRRLEAYADLLSAADSFAITTVIDREGQDEGIRAAMVASGKVHVLGPPEVSQAARKVIDGLIVEWHADDGGESSAEIGANRNEFIEAARKALNG